MSFWDVQDNFKTEKSINFPLSYNCHTKIWYLESFDVWITNDQSNHLFFWDILK